MIIVMGDLVSNFEFGGVAGNVNIVQNGAQYNLAVASSPASAEVKTLLLNIREEMANSEIPAADKQSVGTQLVEILDEIEKPTEQREDRFAKAVGMIKTAAEGAQPVVALATQLLPALKALTGS